MGIAFILQFHSSAWPHVDRRSIVSTARGGECDAVFFQELTAEIRRVSSSSTSSADETVCETSSRRRLR